jgi:hypothetical protein
MTDVVNLNKFRKAKRKQERTEKAKENRVLYGLAKTQKVAARAEVKRAHVQLENTRRNEASEIKSVDDSQ